MLRTESKQILLSIIAISILIIAFVGVSYAAFQTLVSSDENSISTGTISLELSNQSDSISISNAMPMSDQEGMLLEGEGNVYDFNVNTSLSANTVLNYEVSMEKLDVDGEELSDKDVHIYLEKLEGDQYVSTPITHTPQAFTPIMEDSFLGTKSGQMVLYSGTFSNTTDVSKEMVEHFRLRMWVAQDVIIDSTSKSFQVKLNVTAKAV